MKNNYLNKFQQTFEHILNGMSFYDWAENISTSTLRQSNQITDYTKLSKLLSVRKIRRLNYTNINSVKGFVRPCEEGFNLTLSEALYKNSTEMRFIVAHEIAHTFFYDINSNPPKRLIPFLHKSNEIENACNYIATCLLLPKFKLLKEFNTFLEKFHNKEARNLYFLNFATELAEKYKVSWKTVVKRIVDLNLIKTSLIFHFQLENTLHSKHWRLVWSSITQDLHDESLFIPFPKKNQKKPAAHGKLFEILNTIENEIENREYPFYSGYKDIIINELSNSTLGNLKKFINMKFLNRLEEKIKIYYNSDSWNEFPYNKRFIPTIILFINFNHFSN